MSMNSTCQFCEHTFATDRARLFCWDCLPAYGDVHKKVYHYKYQLLWMSVKNEVGPTSKLGKKFRPPKSRTVVQSRSDCKECGTTDGMDWWVGRHSLDKNGKRPTAATRCQRCYNAMIAARYQRRTGAPARRPLGPRVETAIRTWREQRDRSNRMTATAECGECHSVFHPYSDRRLATYRCSWCAEVNEATYRSEATMRRRQAERSGDYGITWRSVGKRDGWTCHLCGESVDQAAGTAYVPKGATVDHLTPIALGGSHTWENVALAHRACNTSRGAKPLAA